MAGEGQLITDDEAAIYDRQIRLWGLDAQKRLRSSQVLLVGLGGLSAEVAKNIVLAGIKSLTLLDHRQVTVDDLKSQFLIGRCDIGKNRAESCLIRLQQLNPLVKMDADKETVDDKADSFFTQFDAVCLSGCSLSQMLRVDALCRLNNILFFASDVFGYYGFFFSDLSKHEFAEDVPSFVKKSTTEENGEPAPKKAKESNGESVTVKKTMSFPSLQESLDFDWSTDGATKRLKRTPVTYFIIRILLAFREKFGHDPAVMEDYPDVIEMRKEVLDQLKIDPSFVPEDFASYCLCELSPVCAVVGGVLGQEIIKAVSKKDSPHKNFFFFNGIEGSGMVDCIPN